MFDRVLNTTERFTEVAHKLWKLFLFQILAINPQRALTGKLHDFVSFSPQILQFRIFPNSNGKMIYCKSTHLSRIWENAKQKAFHTNHCTKNEVFH